VLPLLGRFKKAATPAGPTTVPLDRVRAIASAAAPSGYTSVGKSNKRQPRQPVYKQAIAVLSNGQQAPVVIRNLSLTGCRIEFARGVTPVGRLCLKEETLPLEVWGSVVWKADGACGLAFEHNDQLLDVITSLEAPAPRMPAPSDPQRKVRISIRKR